MTSQLLATALGGLFIALFRTLPGSLVEIASARYRNEPFQNAEFRPSLLGFIPSALGGGYGLFVLASLTPPGLGAVIGGIFGLFAVGLSMVYAIIIARSHVTVMEDRLAYREGYARKIETIKPEDIVAVDMWQSHIRVRCQHGREVHIPLYFSGAARLYAMLKAHSLPGARNV